MKILMVGQFSEYGYTLAHLRAFREMGHDVEAVSIYQEGIGLSSKGSLLDRILWKLGYVRDKAGVNQKLLSLVSNTVPDILWMEKPLNLRSATFRQLRILHPGAISVFFSHDNMQKPHNRSISLSKSFRYYHIAFIIKGYSEQHIRKLGTPIVESVNREYDADIFIPRKQEMQYLHDVVFVGSYERERAERIDFIANNGIRIEVWGDGWLRWKNIHRTKALIHGKGVYGLELSNLWHSSRIVLSFLRRMNNDVTTGRTFEVPATGSFLLAERSISQQNIFMEGKEAEYFGDNIELLKKIIYYLDNNEEREHIAVAGMKKCREGGYSHRDQMKRCLNIIEERRHELLSMGIPK